MEKPLLSGWDFTTIGLLQQLGYNQAADEAKSFADTVSAIDGISSALSANNAWVNLGGFTARVNSPTQLVTLHTSIQSSANAILAQLGGSVSSALAQLKRITGLYVIVNDPQQLLKLITGENPTLFSYTLNAPQVSLSRQQQLATIPISPETLTEIDLYANLAANVSAAATFGFDAKGFFIQNAHVSAALTVGLSGLVNEADLAGFELSGNLTGGVTASLAGTDSFGKVYANRLGPGGIVFSKPNFNFGISAQALGPSEMLGLAIAQFGPYLKQLLGNDVNTVVSILRGKNISVASIATVLDTLYGLQLPAIASVLHQFNVGVAEIASALYRGVTNDLKTVATALYNGVTHDLGQLAAALSSVENSVLDVVGALHQFDKNVSNLANAVWHHWQNTVNWGFNDLTGALSAVDSSISDVVKALYQFDTNPVDLANTVWHYWNNNVGYYLSDLSRALSSVVPNLGAVVSALSSVVNDVGQVARAIWNNFYGSFNFNDLAQNLVAHWAGATLFSLSDLAGALSSTVSDVGQVVNALSTVVGDAEQVAQAVWDKWEGTTLLYADELAGAVEGVFGSAISDAWNFLTSLF